MKSPATVLVAWTLLSAVLLVSAFEEDYFWKDLQVICQERVIPDGCRYYRKATVTMDELERCYPARLPFHARNYYISWAGKGITFTENRRAFNRILLRPKMLRGVTVESLEVSTLGQRVSFPVGIAPTALHTMADRAGENATAAAAASLNTVMILSSHSGVRLEQVASRVRGQGGHLWMQLYVFRNRSYTEDLVRRAERSGFEAIVLNVDADIFPPLTCDAKSHPGIHDAKLANEPVTFSQFKQGSVKFADITWLKSLTKLPIVAKGILTAEDAVKALDAGASAIIVSNHGGRQLDGVPASIDALPDVVRAVKKYPQVRDVYLDSGVRTGQDVFKALALGAKMVFVGRPALWGLAFEGENGVRRVLNLLKTELNNTMILAGHSSIGEINAESIIPSFYSRYGLEQ